MSDERTQRILRSMAWERAKGELRSMLATFFGPENAREGQFANFDSALDEFIATVENSGLHE